MLKNSISRKSASFRQTSGAVFTRTLSVERSLHTTQPSMRSLWAFGPKILRPCTGDSVLQRISLSYSPSSRGTSLKYPKSSKAKRTTSQKGTNSLPRSNTSRYSSPCSNDAVHWPTSSVGWPPIHVFWVRVQVLPAFWLASSAADWPDCVLTPTAWPDCSLDECENVPPMPRKPTEPWTVTEELEPEAASTRQAVAAEDSSSIAVISSMAVASPRMASKPPRRTGPRMMWEP
mmetsp:Transcript_136030/g.422653  ORF Transcript_136030/g.422653 Transcript_136030/m.422653 type:complete len:232 (-) Transcript_136030:984-1679(-)